MKISVPKIDLVSLDMGRPEWSVMIPVCNRLTYLHQALGNVLVQDPGIEKMQICIVDNSTTAIDWTTWLKPSELGRVEIYKQPAHLPLVDNWNSCIQQSRGKLIHILHDDDWVLPGFYQTVNEAAIKHPSSGGFFTRCFMVSQDGDIEQMAGRLPHLEIPSNQPGSLRYNNAIWTPGVVIRRSVYEKIGGFDSRFIFCPDWEMWLRVIRLCSAMSINQPLAAYRFYAANETSRLARTGANLQDCLQLGKLIAQSDKTFDRQLFDQHIENWAHNQACRFRELGDIEAARENEKIRLGLRLKRPFFLRVGRALSVLKRTLISN